MQLPSRGHPLHTRSLTLVVTCREDGRWHARGDVIDLRKTGFVPLAADIQPAGIIHQMSIDLVVDPAASRIDEVAVEQPVVAIEPGPLWGGESCRDPAPRLLALRGEHLDSELSRSLSDAFGGPRGCSHLLTLFQLMAGGLQRALALEAAGGGPTRQAQERLFRRAVFVDGFQDDDDAILLAVQLADFHTRPASDSRALSIDRLAGQSDVRFFARVDPESRTLAGLRLAQRQRDADTLGSARWQDRSARVASLEGASVAGGLARRLFGIFPASEERLLLDTTLQLAPGYIQVMAAVLDRWFEGRPRGSGPPQPGAGPPGAVGGLPDSCYMWRSEGQMVKIRGVE